MKYIPMKYIIFLTAVLTAGFASAQEPSAEEQQKIIERQLKYFTSPRRGLEIQADNIGSIGSVWNGQGTWLTTRIFLRSGGEDELNLSEEQNQKLAYLRKENEMGTDWFRTMQQNPTPEFTAAMQAAQAAVPQDDPMFEKATDEQKQNFIEASANSISLFSQHAQQELVETLTPEQMNTVRKAEMQLMPAIGFPSPAMYEPLGLSDEQKKEMNKITDEMTAEWKQLLKDSSVLKSEQLREAGKALLEQHKKTPLKDLKEFQKERMIFIKKECQDEKYRKRIEELQERGTKFVSLYQSRLMNVLTDEQLDKMQKIMDATPEFAKNLIAQFDKMREANKDRGYVPGPDSWRPGNPVPEQFKKERKSKKFPVTE